MKADQNTILIFSLVMLLIVLMIGLGNTLKAAIIKFLEWIKRQ